MNLRFVQEWTGHKSYQSTLQYAHLVPVTLEKARLALVEIRATRGLKDKQSFQWTMLDDLPKIGAAWDGRVVELVDTRDLKSLGFGLAGSSPAAPTIHLSGVAASVLVSAPMLQ